MTLKSGSGPAAVQTIKAAIGPVPVLCITAAPTMCGDLAPDEHVFAKPLDELAFVKTIKQLTAALAKRPDRPS